MAVSNVSGGMSFNTIDSSISSVTNALETNLDTLIKGLNENSTSADMLNLQMQVQKWTLFTEVQSTIVKDLADAMKGIIQKTN